MENEKPSNLEERNIEGVCIKCKKVQSVKNGIYYCTTPGCEGGFMLPSTRGIALETLKRVRGKHAEFSKGKGQLPHVLNDPHSESFLDAFSKFHTIALFIEKDLNDTSHSTNSHIAMYYLEFFQAAEHFEKLLDDWKMNKEEQI